MIKKYAAKSHKSDLYSSVSAVRALGDAPTAGQLDPGHDMLRH